MYTHIASLLTNTYVSSTFCNRQVRLLNQQHFFCSSQSCLQPRQLRSAPHSQPTTPTMILSSHATTMRWALTPQQTDQHITMALKSNLGPSHGNITNQPRLRLHPRRFSITSSVPLRPRARTHLRTSTPSPGLAIHTQALKLPKAVFARLAGR